MGTLITKYACATCARLISPSAVRRGSTTCDACLSRPRYVLCPGHIRSQHDGQSHYVGAGQLARLYGVALRDCVVFDPQRAGTAEHYPPDWTWLGPRFDGRYELPGRGAERA